jgi:hypothetical protein
MDITEKTRRNRFSTDRRQPLRHAERFSRSPSVFFLDDTTRVDRAMAEVARHLSRHVSRDSGSPSLERLLRRVAAARLVGA